MRQEGLPPAREVFQWQAPITAASNATHGMLADLDSCEEVCGRTTFVEEEALDAKILLRGPVANESGEGHAEITYKTATTASDRAQQFFTRLQRAVMFAKLEPLAEEAINKQSHCSGT